MLMGTHACADFDGKIFRANCQIVTVSVDRITIGEGEAHELVVSVHVLEVVIQRPVET